MNVPDPLAAGSALSLMQDNGDTVWYGDGLDSKDGLLPDFMKDLGETFTYAPISTKDIGHRYPPQESAICRTTCV